jgi:hypothetical protein
MQRRYRDAVTPLMGALIPLLQRSSLGNRLDLTISYFPAQCHGANKSSASSVRE